MGFLKIQKLIRVFRTKGLHFFFKAPAALHLPRFYVYGNVFYFRRGNPIAARSGPANKFARKLTLFPGALKGSIDIEACLLPETFAGKGK